jgi:hypothetical protein
MKLIIKLFILTILTANAFGQNSEKLYPIIKDDLYGYIDKKGNTMIQPQFQSVGNFSEGLAPVRLNGTYGYIDLKGEFIISPKFDLALPFNYGLAKVFIDGKPYFINQKGEIIFNHNFKNISPFGKNTYAIVSTQTDKYGVINKKGNIIIDTLFSKIIEFVEGVAVVDGLNHNPYSYDSIPKVIYEKGVIDTLGNWKVKYGEYKNISEFKNGYARVQLFGEKTKGYATNEGIIDVTGNYKFTVPSKKWNFDYNNGHYNEGIAIVNIFSVDPDTVKVWSSKNRYEYKGAVNTSGEIIFSNVDWVELTPFSFGRAFAKTTNGQWFLIDTLGRKVVHEPFEKVLYNSYDIQTQPIFLNGITLVKIKKGWYTIDTNGKFVSELKNFNDLLDRNITRHENFIVLEKDISNESDEYPYLFGFWNIQTNTIIPPQFHFIDWNGFDGELIPMIKDHNFGYINSDGKKIWEGQNKVNKKQLNIDYMNRGYYYASSKYKSELVGYGGWGSSENLSKNANNTASFLPNKLQLVIDPNQKTKWANKYDAVKLYVANTTKDTIYFDAQDSRLYLKIQAQDRQGEWKDIEYLPNSWCGNSYHTLFLSPNESWEFATPVYEGEFKTKIRAELLYRKSKDQKNHEFIYSNEIEGYVNPGQFWNKQEYFPSGLMDPYND